MAALQDDPFYSPRASLSRAENHISDLDDTIWKYRSTYPPDLVTELDPGGLTQSIKLRFTKSFPQSWTDSAVDALVALRSALDQAAFAAAKVSGNKRPKKTQFPIADSFNALDSLISRVCKDVPVAIVRLFRQFKPYKGGNDTLWILNKLRNSLHTDLVPVTIGGANVLIRRRRGSLKLTLVSPVFDRTKREIVFARAPAKARLIEPDKALKLKAYPTFQIWFDDPTLSQDAVAFLTGAQNEIEKIVDDIEVACCRLGFIK
jgi:hypothetical protein